MKGPLAATIVAAAGADLDRLRKPLYIIITADEETGCHGAKHVAQHSAMLKETPPDYGIIAEPTRLRPVYAHKGFGSLKITAAGKAAHTSTGLGASANFKIAPFLAEMAELNNLFESDESFMNREFSPPTNGFNMTLDDGGCKMNVTASKSICRLSFRVMPDARSDDVVKMVKTSAEQHGLEFSGDYAEAFYVSPESEIVQLASELTGDTQPETVPYGTDGFYLKDLMDLVILGPGDIAVAHTVGESVAVAELEQAVGIYSEAITRVCM
jgi:acetylornithine deacetylase